MKARIIEKFLLVAATLLFISCSGSISSPIYMSGIQSIPYPAFNEAQASRTVFVSPHGSGDGSSESAPTTLDQAITNSQAGDLIYLLAGTYTGTYYLTNNGTKAQPIVYKNYKNQHVKIDGGFYIGRKEDYKGAGSHTWLWGLDITGRKNTEEGAESIYAAAEGTTIINCIIHPTWTNEDSVVALGAWDYPNQFYYGNLIYGGHHNIYAQNSGNISKKYFVHNMSINANNPKQNSTYNFHAYAERGNVSGFRVYENIFADTTLQGNSVKGTALFGGKNQTANNDIIVQSNYFYNTDLVMGYTRPVQSQVLNNYIVDSQLIYEKFWGDGELRFPNQEPILVQNNTLIWFRMLDPHVRLKTSAYILDKNNEINRSDGTEPFRKTDVWDYNTYSPNFMGELEAGGVDAGGFITELSEWQNKTEHAGNKFDEHSKTEDLPTEPKVVVIPNHYEKGRAFIAVYNYSNASSVTVDLSSITQKTGSYKIYKFDDAYGKSVATGSYPAGNVNLPVASGTAEQTESMIFSAFIILPNQI